jgi:hypothetical protein
LYADELDRAGWIEDAAHYRTEARLLELSAAALEDKP